MPETLAEHELFDIVVVGELNVDLILSTNAMPVFGQVEQLVEDATLVLGSSSAIFACGAARLGLRVAYVSRVGDDVFGHFVLGELKKHGIDVQGVILDPTIKTGVCVILSRGEDRAMLTYLGSIACMTLEDVNLLLFARGRHLHVGAYFLQTRLRSRFAELCGLAHQRGLTVSLDTNYDPQEVWDIADTLDHVDIFLPNQTELQAIAKTDSMDGALASYAEKPLIVVVKRGAQGALVQHAAYRAHVPAIPVSVVDTTGAGDSFDAGFIYGHLAGWSLDKSLRLAVVCGALSTRAIGGTEAQPTLDEALKVLNSLS
jgi:sugar/nucleoside kinase (ribokinase family)